MKKIIYSIICLALSFSACEIIPENDQLIEVFTPADTSQIKRASLLIEYSGWRCMNCPNAAEVAHGLKEQYGEELVVVVMHPASNPNTRFGSNQAVNYTCPEADSMYIHMGGTNTTPFPTGNVNFMQQDNAYFASSDTWATQISQCYGSSSIIMNQTVECENKDLALDVYVCNIGSNSQEATLQIWLTEDGVVGKQFMPDGKTNDTYVHNHLLRSSVLPSVWGKTIQMPSVTPQTFEFSYTLPDKVVAENCHVVSVLSIDGVVVQVKETKIITK